MNPDVIVVGLGAMGSAACYQLAKRGVRVLGIDRYSPPHDLGSSHGETRITRLAIGEGIEYVPLAMRSHEIWREIEAETGADLLTVTGGLIMSCSSGEMSLHGNERFIEETVRSARLYGIKHHILNTDEIRKEFPQLNPLGTERGYFEEQAGFLRPENCVKAQIELARKLGAEIRTDEKVLEIKSSPIEVTLVTEKGSYTAGQVIISAGAWVQNFVPPAVKGLFEIHRQTLYWFELQDDVQKFEPGNFPIFIWEFGRWENDYAYGFPAIGGQDGGLKLATEVFEKPTDPNGPKPVITTSETNSMFERYVENRIPGLGRKCLKAASCLYTVTPGFRFIIDRMPDSPNIIVASPCSGHGFKHSAAIGESLAQMAVDGKSKIDISKFSFARFT